jgi:hypothetical protein
MFNLHHTMSLQTEYRLLERPFPSDVLGPLLRLSFDREVPLATNTIFDKPGRDGDLARALNVALHALVVHTGMRAMSEDEEITLDFAGEIETVQRALALLGVDASETLPYLGSVPASPATQAGSD